MSSRRKLLAPEVAPGTDVGSYRVDARLGAGGFGTVFRAERGGELYALKALSLQEVGEWAEREVVVLARVKHPNVARLRGFWQWPDHEPRYLIVVMEYVPGRRLDVWTRTENPSARQVLRLLLGVTRALMAVHRAKVVHRDVKEANIIVRDSDGEAVLVDFGVSGCEEASRVTGGMMPPGTPAYRSPEAWEFRRANKGDPEARYRPTPADDMFALGIVLYWMLTDVLPFAESDIEGVEALLTRPPTAPHVRNSRVPRELSELCLRLLEKQPEARLDAEAACKAVEELLTLEEAVWDEPLCEFFSEHNVTTNPEEGVDEEALWLNEVREAEARPRRGKRPPRLVAVSTLDAPKSAPAADTVPPAPEIPADQELLPGAETGPHASVMPTQQQAPPAGVVPPPRPAQEAPDDSMPEPSPPVLVPALPGATPANMVELRLSVPAMGRWGRTAAGLVLVVALSALASRFSALLPLPARPQALPAPAARTLNPESTRFDAPLPTWEGGSKVAPPLKSPEARRSGLFGFEGAVPMPVAPIATLEEDDASVKTQQQLKKGLGAVKKGLVTGAACTALACPGAQVRPPPEPKPCPPGAVEGMKERGITKWTEEAGTFFLVVGKGMQFTTVSEGWTSVRLLGRWGTLKTGTILSGELIFGERVYGRLTQARTEDGTFPVCIEMWDEEGGRGLKREPNGGSNTAQIWSTMTLRAVDHFE